MKDRTASTPSKGSTWFLMVAVPCMWGLFLWLGDWTLGAIAAIMSLYLLVDVWNMLRVKRASEKGLEVAENKKATEKQG